MDKVNVSYRVDERLTIRGGYNREKKKKKKYSGPSKQSAQSHVLLDLLQIDMKHLISSFTQS